MNAAGMADFVGTETPSSVENDGFAFGKSRTKVQITEPSTAPSAGIEERPYPTKGELATLRRVSGEMPWAAYTIAFVELCERFSFFGTVAVLVNFIQQPLPEGSVTGSAGGQGQAGALGMGQRASTGLTTFNTFWTYVMPLLGAYVADQYWGRMKTIQVSLAVAILGHVILVVSALPAAIAHPTAALACLTVGIVIMGIGVGGFKSNISPLIAEQCTETTIHSISRYLYFYLVINTGSLTGAIGMVYAEFYVGYWLSFLLPTAMLCICPLILFACKNKYKLYPPTGSTLPNAIKLWRLAIKNQWSWNPVHFYRNINKAGFWDAVKPTRLGSSKPSWMTFDDAWVEEVRRGFLACKIFLWYPLYWLAYAQMINNLTSQAATLKLDGVPNDIIANFNPILVIILIPIMDLLIYPTLERMGIRCTPIKRIATGFFLAASAMVAATVTQHYIYQVSPCGKYASTCIDETGYHPANISVWVQLAPYGLIGFSEIMASVTSLEYAFTKAPENMRSTVQAIALFMTAISAALSQALVYLASDPLLVWNYGTVAVLAGVGGILFWFSNRKLDKEEDVLNMLPAGQHFLQQTNSDIERHPLSSALPAFREK